MEKTRLKPDTLIYPLPAVMVSCGAEPEEFNIITIAWTGTICSNPPMCYISVRPARHSYDIIRRTGEFVINLTTPELLKHTDWCGIKSGRDYNKFIENGLTPIKASIVNAPLIKESPVNIECQVREILEPGVHHVFISEVVAINADSQLCEKDGNRLSLDNIKLLSYVKGAYYETGSFLGKYGFTAKESDQY